MAGKVKLGQCYFHCKEFMTCFFTATRTCIFFFFSTNIYALELTLNIFGSKRFRTEKHILANVTLVSFFDLNPFIWTIIPPPLPQGFTLVLFSIRQPFSKIIKNSPYKTRGRFFKKINIKKKGKTFHKKEKQQKKVFHSCVAVLSLLYFFMFENSMSMCHTDFFFPFLWLLISFYFLYGDFQAGAVQFR